ncbi:GNAT family N-acetyltransferase [Shivajiella indica]|uniref:GNAT family N-acetyltransferase n=1 Tax=Shivajiella indica TaxID=872115 RepID=A0ABW5B804_9BACT
MNFSILPFKEDYKDQLVSVWGKSVARTHHFLKLTDFVEIRELVKQMDFTQFEVYCLIQEQKVLGFVGLTGNKVEMLFLDPDHIGKGLGRKLMDFAIQELKANEVDVNEENTNAVTFYKKLGFEVYERSDKDDQGRDYPILKMRLN